MKTTTAVLATVLFLVLAGAAADGQARQPLVYVLSAGDKVVIILGNVPRTVNGFTVYRKAAAESAFSQITDAPVQAVSDPFVARQMMGTDFEWISRRVETMIRMRPGGESERVPTLALSCPS